MIYAIRTIMEAIAEFPSELSRWALTLDDNVFVRLMFVGAVLLTFVLARALR